MPDREINEQRARELAIIERRRELHEMGAPDEDVDGVTADDAGYEWDDVLCPACGSYECCDCDPLEIVEQVRVQVDEAIARDREIRAANIARYPDSTAKRRVCQPCRKGQHVDHQQGVWRKFDGSEPVVCSCERCGGVGSQAVLF